MAHLAGSDRSQLLLLPETVDDYVGPDNPVRFIEAFVDQLDLQIAGFARVQAKATGRPGYDPADLLKLYIYGYLNRVRSSRRLEADRLPVSSGRPQVPTGPISSEISLGSMPHETGPKLRTFRTVCWTDASAR